MLAAVFLPAVLAAAPSPSAGPSLQEPYADFQRKALGLYFGEALDRLRQARRMIEDLQEASLDPHEVDMPAAEALRRLDRAEALVKSSSAALADLVSRFPPEPAQLYGWAPIEDRVSKALELIDRSTAAAEVARLYRTRLAVEVYPIPGPTLALYSSKLKVVRVRGYYAVNAISPEFLAAVLVHEGTHALQHLRRPGRRFRADLAGEREAREIEARFWLELKEPVLKDFQDTQGDQVAAYEKGPKAFDDFVRKNYREAPFWEWVEPAVRAPVEPRPTAASQAEALAEAEPASPLSPKEAAQALREIQSAELSIRHNLELGSLRLLEDTRDALVQVPEVLAPYPRIVNHSTMTMRAESMKDYPLLMRLGYGLLSAVLDELDAARLALAEKRLPPGELETLTKDEALQQPQGPAEDPKLDKRLFDLVQSTSPSKPLGELWGAKGWRIALVPWTTPRLEAEHPDLILIPGAYFMRRPCGSIGAAWVVHQLVHRRQGLAPGAAPSLDQEVEAWAETNRFWSAVDTKDAEDYAPAHGRRFLVMNALWERGGPDLIRLYLRARRTKRAAPDSKRS